MFVNEINVALNFVLSYLYDKLPRRRVNLFGEELEKHLRFKMVAAQQQQLSSVSASSNPIAALFRLNLNAADSERSGTFCINKSEMMIDPALLQACSESAMDIKEVLAYMPSYLRLYMEPGLVGYILEPCLSESQFEVNFKVLYNGSNVSSTLNNQTDLNNNLNESLLKLLNESDPNLSILLNKLALNGDDNNVLRKAMKPNGLMNGKPQANFHLGN